MSTITASVEARSSSKSLSTAFSVGAVLAILGSLGFISLNGLPPREAFAHPVSIVTCALSVIGCLILSFALVRWRTTLPGRLRAGEVRHRAEIAEVGVLEKRLGSLPVIADFSRRLDIAGIIDRVCPIRDIAYTTHGQVMEVLIANRLTNPAAMVGVMDWAKQWAVQETYGVRAEILDDDRLARALDAIAPHLEHIIGSVGAVAIDRFGIDVARMHWDMTVRHEALCDRAEV